MIQVTMTLLVLCLRDWSLSAAWLPTFKTEQVKKGVIRDDEETEKRKELEKTTGIRFFDRDKDLQVRFIGCGVVVAHVLLSCLSHQSCRVALALWIITVCERRLSK